MERAVACLEEHPEAGAVYGEGYHVDEPGTILERYPTEPFSMARLEETCFICQPTVFLRRELVERVGYLDESLRYCMDYDLWIRAGAGGAVRLHAALSRDHARSTPTPRPSASACPVHAEIMTMVRRHFGHVPPSWVYAYAHAVLGPRDRRERWADARFVVGLIGISLVEFLRYNRRVPLAEWARWGALASPRLAAAPGARAVRIGLDVSLVPGQRAGGGQYAYQLARGARRASTG